MRDLLLAFIVLGFCAAALICHRWGLYAYIWFALLRPDIMAYSPPGRPYSLALALATLLSSLRAIPFLAGLIRNPFVVLYLLFQGCILVSVFAAQSVELSFQPYIAFVQVSVMCLLIPLLVQERRDVRILVLVEAFALGTLGSRFGLWGLLRGGIQLTSGYGGSVSDNNVLALALVMVVPLCWYAVQLVRLRWLKALYLTMTVLTTAAIVFCHSRGGALALAGVLLMIVLFSRRKLAAAFILALISVPSIYLVKSSYLNRIESMEEYESDLSAMNRLRFWRAAAEMAVDHPLTGVGFGGSNWVALSSQYLPGGNDGGHFVHNNYLQILVDSGFPALAFFLALLLASFWWLNRQRRRWKTTLPDLAILCGALQASLLGFAIGSTFLSRVAYDFIYILLMTVAALHNVGRSLDAAPAPEVAPATAQPAPVALAPPPPPAVPAPEPRMRLRGLLRGPR